MAVPEHNTHPVQTWILLWIPSQILWSIEQQRPSDIVIGLRRKHVINKKSFTDLVWVFMVWFYWRTLYLLVYIGEKITDRLYRPLARGLNGILTSNVINLIQIFWQFTRKPSIYGRATREVTKMGKFKQFSKYLEFPSNV